MFDLLLLPVIWFIDLINQVFTPFKPFTRPLEMKYYETLEEKKDKFEDHLKKFWQGNILNYRLPIGDAGDQCFHHGLYTAMLSMQSVLTKDKKEALRAADGLWKHQNVKNGRAWLIRGIQADGTKTFNVSNDQLSGHLLGCYYIWKYVNIELGAALLENLGKELINNNHCLVNPDEKPTAYGKLINGFLTDPLNLTLCLAVYRLCYLATGIVRYQETYDELFNKYKWRIPYAHFKFLWLGQSSTAFRSAIHYHILYNETKDNLYMSGMKRLCDMERNTCSPALSYLTSACEVAINGALKHLNEYTVEDKALSVTHNNSDREESFKWGNFKRVSQPLPRWKVRSEDFFDARCWYSCDDIGTGEEHNGGDFLFGYYGLKFLRLI